jgi:hypothetical protein
VVLDQPLASAEQLAAEVGWHLKPEGLCQGDVCIPLPADARADDGRLDVRALAAKGFPVLHDDERGLWAVGPRAGSPVTEGEVPDLVLTGLAGEPVHLVDVLGPDRCVLVAFASW